MKIFFVQSKMMLLGFVLPSAARKPVLVLQFGGRRKGKNRMTYRTEWFFGASASSKCFWFHGASARTYLGTKKNKDGTRNTSTRMGETIKNCKKNTQWVSIRCNLPDWSPWPTFEYKSAIHWLNGITEVLVQYSRQVTGTEWFYEPSSCRRLCRLPCESFGRSESMWKIRLFCGIMALKLYFKDDSKSLPRKPTNNTLRITSATHAVWFQQARFLEFFISSSKWDSATVDHVFGTIWRIAWL